MKPTITEQQARDKVEQYIQGALSVLPTTAGRTLFSRNRSECTDPTDNGPGGRFEISATYEITGLDPAQYPDHFVAVLQWWNTHDFAVLSDKRPANPYLFARNNSDSFDMSIKANDLGKLYVGATSPCVWPNGTPPPRALGRDQTGDRPAAQAATPPIGTATAHPRVRKPRSPRLPVDDEDFAETDWTDEGSS